MSLCTPRQLQEVLLEVFLLNCEPDRRRSRRDQHAGDLVGRLSSARLVQYECSVVTRAGQLIPCRLQRTTCSRAVAGIHDQPLRPATFELGHVKLLNQAAAM